MTFGRMGDIFARVEAAAITSLENRLEHPFLRGNPLVSAIPDFTVPVFAAEVGYVQHIDMSLVYSSALPILIWIYGCARCLGRSFTTQKLLFMWNKKSVILKSSTAYVPLLRLVQSELSTKTPVSG